MAAAASPSWRATAPGLSEAEASWATMSVVESFAFGSRVPLRSRGGEALLRRPRMDGDDRDRVVEAHDLAHAGHGFRLRFVDRDELSAEGRRCRHHREFHTRQPGIDAELRGAVHLAGAVETPVRLSDELEFAQDP